MSWSEGHVSTCLSAQSLGWGVSLSDAQVSDWGLKPSASGGDAVIITVIQQFEEQFTAPTASLLELMQRSDAAERINTPSRPPSSAVSLTSCPFL